MNIELEVRKLTEAYCVENLIPIRRQFTHAELEQSIERVREAAELLSTAQVEAAKGEK